MKQHFLKFPKKQKTLQKHLKIHVNISFWEFPFRWQTYSVYIHDCIFV